MTSPNSIYSVVQSRTVGQEVPHYRGLRIPRVDTSQSGATVSVPPVDSSGPRGVGTWYRGITEVDQCNV